MLKSTQNYMLFLSMLSILKICIFYITIPGVFKLSTVLGTVGWVFLLFFLFTFIIKEWGFGLYCILSAVLFADFLYFQNFGTLPSVRQLILLPQVGKLGTNIKYFTNFFSILFVIDLIPIGIFDRKRYLSIRGIVHETPRWVFTTVLLCGIFAITPLVAEKLKSSQVFNRYGLIAYHAYDIANLFAKSKQEASSAVRIDSQQVSKKKYWAIGANRNVIVIQLESFQNFLVDMKYNGQEVTPNLNKLVHRDSIYFSNYYQQTGAGNTADAEFVSLVSLHIPGEEVAYEKYDDIDFYALPRILKEKGFHTLAMHGNVGWFWNREKIYPHLGFEDFISLEELDQDLVFGMGLNDLSFFEQATDILKNYPQPFLSFLVTISSHTPFIIPDQLKSLELLPEHQGSIFGNYLQAVHYADYALGRFIEKLKQAGLYEKSIVILYGDHAGLYPFNKEAKDDVSKFFKIDYKYKDAMNIPLVVHIPGSKIEEEIKTVGGQIDFLPTVLNILGIQDEKIITLGKDLVNSKNGFVALRYHLPDGSFIDDTRYFEVSNDGIIQNSLGFNSIDGHILPYYECLDGYKIAVQQIENSKHILNSYIEKTAVSPK
ncbi:LTA synthase family protein [Thermotoga profunda]|uniref:LTA synthase family protein n=1 Tax=Thermotoga profunda TaxID=1508420 RepID=UPI000694EE3E|nr:LTA synthase family protein [Thermotoga profunda]